MELAIHLHPLVCTAPVPVGMQTLAQALTVNPMLQLTLPLIAQNTGLLTFETWDELLDVAQRLANWIDGGDLTAEDDAILTEAFLPVVVAR